MAFYNFSKKILTTKFYQVFFNPSYPLVPKKSRIFYGYIIILISILAAIITAPGQTVGVSVFTDYFIKAFHLSRLQLSLAYMLGTIGSSLIIGRAGVLIDNLGSRFVGVFAAMALGVTLILLSQLDKISQRYHVLTFLLVIMGFFMLRLFAQGILSLISRTMVLHWFVSLRGRVTAIVGIFTTLSMSISPVVFNWLIIIFGWQHSYLIMGLVIGIICAIILWLFARNTPEECDLKPDGKFHKEISAKTAMAKHSWTLAQAKTTYTFWAFCLSLALYSLIATAFAFNVTSIFAKAELSRHMAITVFFPATCISVVVKIISGWLCDLEPWQNKLKYQLMIFLLGLGIFCLGMIMLKHIFGRDLIIIGLGVSTGLFVTLSAVCWPQFFGRKYLGSIIGANASYLIFASAIGPLLFAISAKLTSSYSTAILICMALIFIFFGLASKADAPT